MPGTRPPRIHQYTPTEGVRSDFKRLMNKFLSFNTVRYEHFSKVWREQKMSYMFACRGTDREAREFTERVFIIAQEYFLPPFQFQVRVGGLYLLYAIYQIQPLTPKVKIRMTKCQWQDTSFFMYQAMQQSHLDVAYVYNKMLCDQAFYFCFTALEMCHRSNFVDADDDGANYAQQLVEEKGSIHKLFNYESLEQLSYLQERYRQMKIALSGPEATKPDKSLDVVQEGLVEDTLLLFQTFQEKASEMYSNKQKANVQESCEDTTEKKQDTTRERRQAIKAQAYSQVTASSSSKSYEIKAVDPKTLSAPEVTTKSPPKSKQTPVRPDVFNSQNIPNKTWSMPILCDSDSSLSDEDDDDDDDDDEDYIPPAQQTCLRTKEMETKNAVQKTKLKEVVKVSPGKVVKVSSDFKVNKSSKTSSPTKSRPSEQSEQFAGVMKVNSSVDGKSPSKKNGKRTSEINTDCNVTDKKQRRLSDSVHSEIEFMDEPRQIKPVKVRHAHVVKGVKTTLHQKKEDRGKSSAESNPGGIIKKIGSRLVILSENGNDKRMSLSALREAAKSGNIKCEGTGGDKVHINIENNEGKSGKRFVVKEERTQAVEQNPDIKKGGYSLHSDEGNMRQDRNKIIPTSKAAKVIAKKEEKDVVVHLPSGTEYKYF